MLFLRFVPEMFLRIGFSQEHFLGENVLKICSQDEANSQEQAGNKVMNSLFIRQHKGKLKNVPVFLKKPINYKKSDLSSHNI